MDELTGDAYHGDGLAPEGVYGDGDGDGYGNGTGDWYNDRCGDGYGDGDGSGDGKGFWWYEEV